METKFKVKNWKVSTSLSIEGKTGIEEDGHIFVQENGLLAKLKFNDYFTDMFRGKNVKVTIETIEENNMKVVDHRRENTIGRFSTDSVEAIETIGKDSDYIVILKNGQKHIYRCSCAITFERVGNTTQVIIS
jgi:hypothetical protein